MGENITLFFSDAYPFSACVWVDNQEDAPQVSRSVCFPLMKQTSEFINTSMLNGNFNTCSVFPRDILFPGKGFTGKVECQWKERSNKTLMSHG